jgi:hypothetical protein
LRWFHRLNDQRKARRPVVALASDQPDAHRIPAGHQTVAVVLDLMNPVQARRRRWGGGGQARRVYLLGRVGGLKREQKLTPSSLTARRNPQLLPGASTRRRLPSAPALLVTPDKWRPPRSLGRRGTGRRRVIRKSGRSPARPHVAQLEPFVAPRPGKGRRRRCTRGSAPASAPVL